MSKRHLLFNISMILFPWLSTIFLGKRNIKRFLPAALVIGIWEIINHKYGQKRNWWIFYNKRRSFLTDELPFTLGPYMPLSMWMLKFSFGNFRKFLVINAIADGIFAFIVINILKKIKIIGLYRLNNIQFFVYLYYKVFLLYGVHYAIEKMRR
ncbi:hypothetical protein [Aquibacillus sediminis]|uniref:hypothetical protein n=1 Tax=Aquibacillus sediminis TaxID=2574734 RepID=UPI00319E49F0